MIKSLPNLYAELKLTKLQLASIIASIPDHYSPVEVPKKKYGVNQVDEKNKIRTRDLMVPDYLLKSIQGHIAALLAQNDFPEYMYGSIKHRNNIQNARQHLGHQHFATIDLKKFFPNINHHQVNRMFVKNGFSYDVAHLLTKLSTFKYSLPQGAPSSPVIANLVFKETADKLYILSKKNQVTFTSFLDDLTFSSDQPLKNFVPEIIAIIKEGGFFPSYKKIHCRKKYCEVTGLFVKRSSLELPYRMQKKVKSNYYLKVYAHSVKNAAF